MTSRGPPDLETAVRRIVNSALAEEHYAELFASFCGELVTAGVPLLRAQLAMHTLHPLVSAVDLTWYRGEGLEMNARAHSPEPARAWLHSPLYWLLTNKKWELRKNLLDPGVVAEFEIFKAFRDRGGTDYLALLTPFGDPNTAFERGDGILTSWVCDAPAGFGERDVEAIKYLQPYVGLIAKLARHDNTTRNVLSAYLGADAGRRVLQGQIRLGDVEQIPAVIWFSDLRGSTAMAERMPVESFLRAVNAYFDCTAGAVLEHGGEVLRFIGDAVLAVFPITSVASPARAARQALAASHEARQRLVALNKRRAEDSEAPLEFGLGLHVGELLYGNIGVPSRVEFSVIGPAANEVSRLESLTKDVGETVLVSKAFKNTLDLPWRHLGVHRVKGVSEGMDVFAPPRSE